MKKWITSVMETLEACLGPVSHEINEPDWKQSLSPMKERLMQHLSVFANHPDDRERTFPAFVNGMQHLSVFANHPDGGVFVYGINNQTATPNGIQQNEAEVIFGQIANLGRDALELPVAIDHAIVGFHNASLLFVHTKREKMISKSHYLRHGSFQKCPRWSGLRYVINMQRLNISVVAPWTIP